MRIKTLLLGFLFCSFGITVFAQRSAADSDAEADAILTLLGIQKKEAVARLVHVEKKDSAAFWKLYEDYLVANKVNAKTRMQLYQKTADAYSNMTEKTADSLATHFYKQRNDQEEMLHKYYSKIAKAVNPIVGFQFYQAEVYLMTEIRVQIMKQIPTYGELLNSRSK